MKVRAWWGQLRSFHHVGRTTLGAVASLGVASLLTLREPYWAAITTLIVMQSDLESTLTLSARRLVGTALGAALGAVLLTSIGPTMPAFALGVFVAGVACIVLGCVSKRLSGFVDRTAYRYAGITLAVIMLIPHVPSIWTVALDRFIEVSIGIVVALVVTKLWLGDPDKLA